MATVTRLVLSLVAPCLLWHAAAGAQDTDDTVRLTILHSSDVYGQLKPRTWEGARFGGMAARVQLIREIRASGPTLVLDAGDAIGPNPLSASDRGATMVALMRRAGYAAMVPGNHEFSHGLGELHQLQKEAGFPLLAANVKSRDGSPLPWRDHTFLDLGGIPVGILGIISPEAAALIHRRNAENLVFDGAIDAATESVTALRRRGAAYVVALVHARESEALDLARRVPGIDLVVAGGYRDLHRVPGVPVHSYLLSGVHIVTTPRYGLYLGKVEITFSREPDGTCKALRVEATQLPIDSDLPGDPVSSDAIVRLETSYRGTAGESLGRIEGETLDAQALLVANLMRQYAGAEVGLVNRGGLRRVPFDRDLDMRDVHRLIRFDDRPASLNLAGRHLRALIRKSQQAGEESSGLIVAGMDPGEMTVKGRPIRDDETYSIVTTEFLARGGDGYTEFGQGDSPKGLETSLRGLVIATLKEKGSLSSESFSDLDRQGVWRSGWSLDGAFDQNYVDGTTVAYRAQDEQVPFLGGETSVAWNVASRFSLDYEVGRHVMLLASRTEFGQLGSTFSDLASSSDQIDAELDYRYRSQALDVDPFVSSGLNTAFTRIDGRRPVIVRGSVGVQKGFLREEVTARLAGRGQRDLFAEVTDLGVEVTLGLQHKLRPGVALRSSMRGFFGFTDRRLISIENYNTLSVPLVGALSLSVRQNNFLYRVTHIKKNRVQGTAFRTNLSVGLSYGVDWKWL